MIKVFPKYLIENIDYSSWMKYTSNLPLADRIYYSNGIITTGEMEKISGQEFIIAQNSPIPDITSCRISLVNLDTVCVYDFSKQESFTSTYERLPKTTVSYLGDRVCYDIQYNSLLKGYIEEYIPWNSNSLIHKVALSRPLEGNLQDSRVRFGVRVFGNDLRSIEYDNKHNCLHFFDNLCPFHIIIKADQPVESWAINPMNYGIPDVKAYSNKKRYSPQHHQFGALGFLFPLGLGEIKILSVVFSFGVTKEEALIESERILADEDKLSAETRKFWNEYYASCPKVAPDLEIPYTNYASKKTYSIDPVNLVKSELWNWRGVLTDVCRAKYLKCSPIIIADWGQFIGMWANDGIEEAVALSYTNQKELAKECIINWFKYSVNYKGDGHCVWTLYPSSLTSFDHIGSLDEKTEGVPLQGRVVGSYVRATGDLSILDARLGDRAQNRTLWQQLKSYEENLLNLRDINNDYLIDWTNIYETGWDNKHSPFIKKKGSFSSAINEQVFHLWSLSELVYISRLKNEDYSRWEEEIKIIKDTVEKKLWSGKDKFYHDFNIVDNTLWTQAKNLDAFYWLYYETNKKRIKQLIEKLNDPKMFNLSLLPTLSIDNPSFKRDGYWDGRSWPRIHSYVGIALSRAGYANLGFRWVAKAILANLGPICPETLDPLADPVEESFVGDCKLMGYNALNCVALADISGIQMWVGENLTLVPHSDLPKIYITEQKWNGNSYSTILYPKEGMTLYQDSKEIGTFSYGAEFKFMSIHLNSGSVVFEVTTQKDHDGPVFISVPINANVYIDGDFVKKIVSKKKYLLPIDRNKHLIQYQFCE